MTPGRRASSATVPTRCATSCCGRSASRRDGNFTWERFDERYTADLADGLGNLASRSLAMLDKYRDGVVPDRPASTAAGPGGRGRARAYARAMDAVRPPGRRARRPGRWSPTANLYIVADRAVGAGQGRAARPSWTTRWPALARCLYRLAVLAVPFMPERPRCSGRRWGSRERLAGARLGAAGSPSGGRAAHRRPAGALPQARQRLEVRLSETKPFDSAKIYPAVCLLTSRSRGGSLTRFP